jgi:hypothetical protein
MSVLEYLAKPRRLEGVWGRKCGEAHIWTWRAESSRWSPPPVRVDEAIPVNSSSTQLLKIIAR